MAQAMRLCKNETSMQRLNAAAGIEFCWIGPGHWTGPVSLALIVLLNLIQRLCFGAGDWIDPVAFGSVGLFDWIQCVSCSAPNRRRRLGRSNWLNTSRPDQFDPMAFTYGFAVEQ